jgi:nicotinic acid phosphoribosyltransferase
MRSTHTLALVARVAVVAAAAAAVAARARRGVADGEELAELGTRRGAGGQAARGVDRGLELDARVCAPPARQPL